MVPHLSSPRAATYKSFFRCRTSEELLGAYFWNQAIGAAFWPLISIVEITLRNASHSSLSRVYSGTDSYAWFDQSLPKHMPLKGSALKQADDLLANPISPDDFVAQTSFGFWLEALRQIEKGQRYRRASEIMPFNPYKADRSAWKFPDATWTQCLKPFSEVKEFRDRIAHHKPLFRWKAPAATALPTRPAEALRSLIQLEERAVEALSWIDPSLPRVWRSSFGYQWYLRLCSTDALSNFIHNGHAVGVGIHRPPRFAYHRAKSLFT